MPRKKKKRAATENVRSRQQNIVSADSLVYVNLTLLYFFVVVGGLCHGRATFRRRAIHVHVM